MQLRAVDRHDVPAGGPGAEGIRGDDLDVLGEQIVKRLETLGIALADGHHHDRVLGDAVVLLSVPVGRDLSGFDQTDHVAALGEVDDGGGLAGLDRAALVAGGAEGVAEADVRPIRGCLEARLERFLVDGLGSRVADHVELAAGGTGGRVVVAATATGDHQSDQSQ